MEFIVEQSGQRIDRFLADKAPSISRSQWQKNIKGGAIRINGHYVIQPGFKLRADDRVVVLEEKILGKDGEFVIVPQGEIPLGIIYEDDDLVVVNKPAGLLTHPTLSHRKNTLVNALIARYPQMVEVGENPLRPGIVHRLDKDTSGLLAAAKNQKAFLYLKEQFLKRTVEKKYLALVEGVPKESEGVIEYAIRPSRANRLKKVAVRHPMGIAKKSVRLAKTYYKIIRVIDGKFSLLEVHPLTGRTHQIRVHLSSINLPIVGDSLYGNRQSKLKKLLKRQFLHAYYLKLKAPNGNPLALEIDLPNDLKKILDVIQTVR